MIPVKEDMRGLLREWRDYDLPLKTTAQCELLDLFGSYYSVGSEHTAQKFYVTAKKPIRAVGHQIGRARCGRMEH